MVGCLLCWHKVHVQQMHCSIRGLILYVFMLMLLSSYPAVQPKDSVLEQEHALRVCFGVPHAIEVLVHGRHSVTACTTILWLCAAVCVL